MLMQCDYCDAKFRSKELLSNHILMHPTNDEKLNKFKCIMCNINFPNKVLLNGHITKVHNKNKKFKMKGNDVQKKKRICVACLDEFKYNCQLKYHIRKEHFNLTGQIPYYELKSINQVWFERVLNTNVIVEIKKMPNNYFLIRKLKYGSTPINVTDTEREMFDLRNTYPVYDGMRLITCGVCSKVCCKKNFKKHFDRFHGQE